METTQTVAVTPVLNITFNHDAPTTPETLGLTPERGNEILEEVKNSAKTTESRSKHIECILNTYTLPNELVWALFAAVTEEAEADSESFNEDSEKTMAVFED